MKRELSWPKWFIVVFLSGLAVVSLVAGFNYTIDVAIVFRNTDAIQRAAKWVAEGKRVAGPGNFDRRIFHEHVLRNQDESVDIMAVGFSRTIQLAREDLHLPPGVRFFNNSMTSGVMEDYVSIFGLYKKLKGYIPRIVIFGIEPWAFNDSFKEEQWRSIEWAHEFLMSELGLQQPARLPIQKKYLELVNLQYTMRNLEEVFWRIWLEEVFWRVWDEGGVSGLRDYLSKRMEGDETNTQFRVVDSIHIDAYVFDSDGSLHYPFAVIFPDDKKVQELGRGYAKSANSIVNWEKLSKVDLFERLVKYLKQQGSIPVLLLNAYHPSAYEGLMKDSRFHLLADLESYLREFARKEDLVVVGSYDPSVFDFKSTDFQDAMHAQARILRRLFSESKEFRTLIENTFAN